MALSDVTNVYLSFQSYPNLLYLAITRVYKILPKDEDQKILTA